MASGLFFGRVQKSAGISLRTAKLLLAGFALLQGVVAFCPAGAQQPAGSPERARTYFANAQEALAAGDSATAIDKLNQAIQADSKFADAYLLLGLTEFRHGDTQKSIEHYQKALQLKPQSYSGHYNLALAYLREHKLQDGRLHLEQAVKLDPTQADAAYDLGVVLLELGQPSRALSPLTQARKLNPRQPDVAFNVIRAQIEAGHVPEARAEAQAAAGIFGSDFEWSAAVGQLFLKNSQAGDAAVYLGEANRIRPGVVEICHQLAEAYLESGHPDQVLEIIPEGKTYEDHYLRGSAFYLDHRFEDADRESEAALALAPDNPQVLILRVRLLQRAGQQDAALELALKASSLATNWYEPYYLAGVSLYFIRRYNEAGQKLARAVELNPESARALFLEAVALVNQGQHDEAQKCLRRAITLQPKNARFHCHLGILLAREDDYAGAEKSLRKAIELNPNYALSHYELGKLLVHSRQWQEGSEELNQAVHYDPGLSAAYYQLARVYEKLGETEKSKSVMAQFEKLYQGQSNDSQELDDDARKETE
ncbi:MAG: tetratricopeptide repeat protein [Terriglobales bacterium]